MRIGSIIPLPAPQAPAPGPAAQCTSRSDKTSRSCSPDRNVRFQTPQSPARTATPPTRRAETGTPARDPDRIPAADAPPPGRRTPAMSIPTAPTNPLHNTSFLPAGSKMPALPPGKNCAGRCGTFPFRAGQNGSNNADVPPVQKNGPARISLSRRNKRKAARRTRLSPSEPSFPVCV